jgi:signal transduction histidine kinase
MIVNLPTAENFASPALGPGAVWRGLTAYTEPSINWLMMCNWLAMALMMGTAYLLLPTQQALALQWFGMGTAFSLVFLFWRRRGMRVTSGVISMIFWLWVPGFAGWWVAVPLLFFDPTNFAFSMFMLTITGGLAAACIPILSIWLPLYWAFVLPPFLTQIALYWWSGGVHYHSVSLGMTLLMFSQLVFARNTNRSMVASVKLGLQNLKLVAQLEEKTAIAEKANRAKTMFLAAASHDLRQPVYALTLFIDALDGSGLNPAQQGMLRHARVANQASSDMLKTLLDFSRVDAGVVNPQMRPIELAPLLQQMDEEFGPQAYQKDLLYRTHPTTGWVHSDEQLIALILRNLISNALRYTASGGVLVGIRRRSDTLALQVWDTGIGIAADKHAEVFEEFLQLGNPERDQRKGLGMGLAIAAGLARSLRAHITLASRPGRGSVFSLVLPLGREPVRDSSDQPENTDVAPFITVPPRSLQGMTVLVVDDDETVRAGLHAVLQNWGCTVLLAEGLDDALKHVAKRRPDALITDYRLRDGLTGGTVIKVLRATLGTNGEHPLPSIIITGDTHPERLMEAQNHGTLLLHKPLGAGTLRDALLDVLGYSLAE